MSYRGALGQAKIVPGQVNFLDPRASYREFRTPGYIEHGSWVTGQPDVVAWDRPPGAGLQMFSARGLKSSGFGMGQILTDFACSGSALNNSWTIRTRDTLGAGAQAAIAGGLLAGVLGAMTKKPAIGAAAGAAIAFAAFRVWTAPYQV